MTPHLSIIRQLLIESGEINERIHAGDICSNKTGLPVARKLCDRYAKILRAEKVEDLFLDPYAAYGGWIGITYGYIYEGEIFGGSVVVRTLA